jgi:AbiU2
MKSTKVLADLIASATGAKAHYDIWWALVSDAKPQYVSTMNAHSDFFLASQDAHYTAAFIYFAHLFDRRPDSSSLPTYFNAIRNMTEPAKLKKFEDEYHALSLRAAPLVTIRHKSVAHIDARLTETEVCRPLQLTWNEIRSVIDDTAWLVARLGGATHLGAVGIPRDGRLRDATLQLFHALNRAYL